MREEKIALHLGRNAINRIISPPCANLRIIVATNPENRSQAERKERGLRRQPLTMLNPQARMTNMLNPQAQMTNFQSGSRAPGTGQENKSDWKGWW